MLIAIFAVIMLINRQTGGMLDGVMLFVLPIPIVAYAVRYGGKASLAVFFCMIFVSILFGSLSAVFYGVSAALIGLVYGTCLYHKVDMTKTLILVMMLTIVVELMNLVVVAGLYGIGLDEDVQQMQLMFNQMVEQTGIQMPDSILEEGSLRRLLLITMAFSGAIEGALIYGLTIVVLRKLRIPVQRLTPFTEIYPPKWTGLAAGAAWLWYASTLSQQSAMAQGLVSANANSLAARCVQNDLAMGITQVVGMVGYLYLFVFGVMALSLVIARYITRRKGIMILLTFLAMFMVTILVLFLGILYISGSLHDRLLGRRTSY